MDGVRLVVRFGELEWRSDGSLGGLLTGRMLWLYLCEWLWLCLCLSGMDLGRDRGRVWQWGRQGSDDV